MEWMNIDKDINQLQDTDFQYKENVFPLYNESNNIDWDNFINSKSSLSNNFDETSEIISVNIAIQKVQQQIKIKIILQLIIIIQL